MFKKILIYTLTFIAAITAFVVLMTLVYCIPTGSVISNVESSLAILKSQGEYPIIIGNAKLDNFTDIIMIDRNIVYGQNSLFEAMNNLDYNRYWHGYLVFLRPMLLVGNITFIKVVNCVLFFALLAYVSYLLYKRLNLRTVFSFLFSVISVGFFVIPLSMQFVTVFFVSFVFIIILLNVKGVENKEYVPLMFFVVGMITNFLDFLTVPLITLGVPLVIYMLLRVKNGYGDTKTNVKKAIAIIILWFVGYGLCWVSKWAIASVVLKENVFATAIDSIFFRTVGNEQYSGNPIFAVGSNLGLLLYQFIPYSVVMVALIVSTIVLRVKYKNFNGGLGKQTIIFWLAAVMPYCWYLVLANHSYLHSWFTFRAQIITIFAITVALTWNTDIEKIISDIKNKRKKRSAEFSEKE